MQPIKHESKKDLRKLLNKEKKNLKALNVLYFYRDNFSNVILLNTVVN